MANIEIGQKYGRLTIIDVIYPIKNSKPRILCRCECGNTKIADFYNVRAGRTKSCGCLFLQGNNTKHGDIRTRLYGIWKGMIQRCRNNTSYGRYGGRGISVCDEWKDYRNFKSWAIDHGYEDTLTIDRIDVNGNYEPSNCRFATYSEQANNRSSNRFITFKGETRTMTEWARYFGVPYGRLWARLSRGWDFERAIKEEPAWKAQEMM